MEQTIGKRIIAQRKKLGLTQDQLAEKLGVTAQAVSKWENDQSCPDITMLPKLAEIFGTTTDELLGRESAQKIYEGEIVGDPSIDEETKENEGIHFNHGDFEFKLDAGTKRGSIGIAVLILAVGALTLASELFKWDVSFWSILWPTTLLVFGLFGVLPRLSFFRLGCLIFGTYFLLDNLNIIPFQFGGNLVFPVILLLFGLSLLIDVLRKPRRIFRFNKKHKHSANYSVDGESFDVSVCFGEDQRKICLPRLSYGSLNVSFGECNIDLSGVEEVADECTIDANCSFGELAIHVPSRYLVQCANNTSFADISVKGQPDSVIQGTVYINANASFGEISIKYI